MKSNLLLSTTFLFILFSCDGNYLNNQQHSDNQVICNTSVKEIDGITVDKVCTTFYPNDQVKKVESFKDSLIQGPVVNYHENGNVKDSSLWVKGKRVGDVKYYDKTGSLINHEKWIVLKSSSKHVSRFYIFDNGLVDTSKSVFLNLNVKPSKSKSCYELNMEFFSPFNGDSVKMVFGSMNEQTGDFERSECFVDTTFIKRNNYTICYPCMNYGEKGELGVKLYHFTEKESLARGLVKPFLIEVE